MYPPQMCVTKYYMYVLDIILEHVLYMYMYVWLHYLLFLHPCYEFVVARKLGGREGRGGRGEGRGGGKELGEEPEEEGEEERERGRGKLYMYMYVVLVLSVWCSTCS